MGRPQADSPSSFPSDYPQMDDQQSDPLANQYQYQPETDTSGGPQEISPTAHEFQFNPDNHQDDPTSQQQQFQPPPPPPPPQQTMQPNPTYPTQPIPHPPINYPPQAVYHPNQPVTHAQPTNYPPQESSQTYPPQAPQARPTNYPPQASPQTYPPQAVQAHPMNYPPQASPQTYPPQAVQAQPMNYQPQVYNPQSASPHKPPGQLNGSATPGFPVTQQYTQVSPMPVYGRTVGTVGWTTGLFDCMDDPNNALITALFPCLTFGQVAEIVDNGHTTCGTSGIIYGGIACLIWLPCLLSCTYRTKLRNKYNLVEAPAPDWVTHFLCEWCALCQEYRELRNRGLDPSIGWQGNAIKNQNMQQPQVSMMPPPNQTMM